MSLQILRKALEEKVKQPLVTPLEIRRVLLGLGYQRYHDRIRGDLSKMRIRAIEHGLKAKDYGVYGDSFYTYEVAFNYLRRLEERELISLEGHTELGSLLQRAEQNRLSLTDTLSEYRDF